MKLAIISATKNGALLGEKTAQLLTKLDVDTYAKQDKTIGSAQEYTSLSQLISRIYSNYDAILFILATGIAVRVIARHLQDKRTDPAVLVMDEQGQHIISLLSGHIGGANRLAREISALVGATPVITTATDVNRRLAPDEVAAQFNLKIHPFAALKQVNAAMANSERVVYFLADDFLPAQSIRKVLSLTETVWPLEKLADLSQYDAAVIVSENDFAIAKPHVYLRPQGLAIGVGCRRGTTKETIMAAITSACNSIGKGLTDITILASVDVKQDEVGLLALAQELKIPIKFYTAQQLDTCIQENGLQVSVFVEKKIGVGNVCEAAALLAGRTKLLWKNKTIYEKVTVAIAPAYYRLWE